MFEEINMNGDNEKEPSMLENIDCSDVFNTSHALTWFCILLK